MYVCSDGQNVTKYNSLFLKVKLKVQFQCVYVGTWSL